MSEIDVQRDIVDITFVSKGEFAEDAAKPEYFIELTAWTPEQMKV
jgi:hypothetical protein